MPDDYYSAVIAEKKIIRPRVKVTYPQVSGLKNKLAQVKINEILRRKVNEMIKEQLSSAQTEVWGGYKIKLNEKSLLSVVFEIYSYTKGAAHGLTVVKSVTVDLGDGKLYSLRDLFREGSGYKARMNAIIKQQIKEKDVTLIASFESINENQDYYLTPQTLVIYFQLYEYTPYAYGIPEFPITYASLGDSIRENGPIGRLVG